MNREKRAYKYWTTGDLARLREMHGRSMSYAEIAQALGRGEGSVARKAQLEGLAEPRTDLRGRVMRKVRIDPETGCWMWTGGLRNGHPTINTEPRHRGPGSGRNARAVLLQLDGVWRPSSFVCRSKCGDAMCIAPQHAQQLTRQQHLRQIRLKPGDGLGLAFGAAVATRRRAQSRLTIEMVRKAREDIAAGISRDEIMAWWPYSRTTLDDVLSGRTWRESASTGLAAASVFSWRPAAPQNVAKGRRA